MIAGLERAGDVEAQHPQRRVLVVRVVEEAGIVGPMPADTSPPTVSRPSPSTIGSEGSV